MSDSVSQGSLVLLVYSDVKDTKLPLFSLHIKFSWIWSYNVQNTNLEWILSQFLANKDYKVVAILKNHIMETMFHLAIIWLVLFGKLDQQ